MDVPPHLMMPPPVERKARLAHKGLTLPDGSINVNATVFRLSKREHQYATVLFAMQALVYYLVADIFPLSRSVIMYRIVHSGTHIRFDPVHLFNFNLASCAWVFFCFASLHHVVLLLPPVFRVYCQQLAGEANPFRASEYCFSSTVMVVIIAQILGIENITTLVLVGVANFTLQAMGYLAEKYMCRVTHVLAWVPFIASWVPIFVQYQANMRMVDNDTFSPTYLHVLVLVTFLLFCTFGVLQSWYMVTKRDFIQLEWGYVLLSLLTKSFLGMLILMASSEFAGLPAGPYSRTVKIDSGQMLGL